MRSVLVLNAPIAMVLSASSPADTYTDISAKETRLVAYDYAKCVVGRHAASASAALLIDEDNGTMMRSHRDLIDGDCLVQTMHTGARMKFPGELYRYALADALFLRELASAPAIDPSNVPPLERRTLSDPPAALPANASNNAKAKYEEATKGFDETKSFRVLGEYGECVVRANPAAAKALLLTRPETAGENSSFDALRSALAECLPPDRTLTFGKLVLRGTIAVNYYRLAHSLRQVGGKRTPAGGQSYGEDLSSPNLATRSPMRGAMARAALRSPSAPDASPILRFTIPRM